MATGPLTFPYRTLALRVLLDAAVVWLGVRFAIAVSGIGLATTWPVAGGVVVLTVALVVADMRRRRRHILLQNLGVSEIAVAVAAAIPPAVFETVWGFASLR